MVTQKTLSPWMNDCGTYDYVCFSCTWMHSSTRILQWVSVVIVGSVNGRGRVRACGVLSCCGRILALHMMWNALYCQVAVTDLEQDHMEVIKRTLRSWLMRCHVSFLW